MTPSTRLETEKPEVTPPPSRWRRITSTVLGILAGLMLVIAVAAGYAGVLISNTDRYVAAVGPVIADPAVQSDISTKISDQVTSQLDVSAAVTNAVAGVDDSPTARALAAAAAPVVAERTDALIDKAIGRVVASPAFATLWTDANRKAHEALVRALDDQPGGVVNVSDNGDVTISTTAMVGEVKSRLLDRGISAASAIPDDAGRDYTVFSAPGLGSALSALQALGRAAVILPWVAAALAVAAVLTAPAGRRLRAGTVFAIASASAAVAALLALRFIEQSGVENAVSGSAVSPQSAAALSDALLGPLSALLRTVVILALLAIGVIYAVVHRRRWLPWALRHVRSVQASAAGVILLVLVIPGISAAVTIGICLIMAALIVVLELELRASRRPAPSSS
ncbi:hypothetical protein ITX31_13405 [Arthrobacter gandavensis]|uniref:hypothetical protein n=1 Tax=Arthrobacter gandavensis TaxID=169960 RepID=UPI00188DD4EA|nr:hypothetical protein [Arthrobacter gandavensis]MBF4995100.1 hypothetical protein [Arthrobacter gandavensis]